MMRKHVLAGFLCAAAFFVSACASPSRLVMETEGGRSATSDTLDCCDDFRRQVTRLEAGKEVVMLVHGCKSSSGRFSTLKDVFESRGQQALCFSYDYRDSIEECSAKLVCALNSVDDLLDPSSITVIGHSQGGLVARRALIRDRSDALSLKVDAGKIRLVTVSSPFNGIKASSHCGITALHVVTAGTTVLVCKAIAGSTWNEIHPRSDLIHEPGVMDASVSSHLKINTDERDVCRTVDAEGACVEDDFVFALDEQYADVIDRDERVVNVELKAGHAKVIGVTGQPPFGLIGVLEENSVLRTQTRLSRADDVMLLNRLYR